MALINWNDSFSVNVAVIDQQHKKLVDMINDLNDAMKQGKGKDVAHVGLIQALVKAEKCRYPAPGQEPQPRESP